MNDSKRERPTRLAQPRARARAAAAQLVHNEPLGHAVGREIDGALEVRAVSTFTFQWLRGEILTFPSHPALSNPTP